MNGQNRETDPIERSISACTISSTSPTARIANGAKYGSSVTKFAVVKKLGTLIEKYSAASSVTTMMLPSRSVKKRLSRSPAPGRAGFAAPLGSGGAAADAGAVIDHSGLGDAGLVRGSLIAALGLVVRGDRGLVQELQARVGVGDAAQRARRLVHEQLQDRDEALQVGLLVDREVELVGGQQLLGDRREVVAARLDALGAQVVLLHRLSDRLGAAGVDREVALGLRVALGVGVDDTQLRRHGRAGGDRVGRDALARLLDHVEGTVDARLDVRGAGRRDEQRHVTR